jgi:AraC-like DNA-binding protein/mannose-6-phosphate isomerase-like protein (cupin superfamily)
MSSSQNQMGFVPVQILHFENFAPGRPYHAALSVTRESGAYGFRATEHAHDFYEMLFVVDGGAIHGLNGDATILHPGDLVLLRPQDRHYLRFQTGRHFHYINIAIDAALWRDFHHLAGIASDIPAPVTRNTHTSTESDSFAECFAAFQRALVRFQDTQATNAALRTEACRLLATVAPLLLPDEPQKNIPATELPEGTPAWLVRACGLLQNDPESLRGGLPVFVAHAGVTRTHLARVLKSAIQQTPTEYVNGLRLERAARLLTTSSLSILEIAGECGFEQATYFYRLFQARFQTSPHAYRSAAARHIAPG